MNGFVPDQWGGQGAGFSAAGQINRHDFAINISIPMDGGGVAVGDKGSKPDAASLAKPAKRHLAGFMTP